MTKQNALTILGLDSTATPKEIKRKYKTLLLKLHPNKGGSHNDFLIVRRAYKEGILKDF